MDPTREVVGTELTTVILILVLISKFISGSEDIDSSIYNAEILILLIASTQYLITLTLTDLRQIQRLRYLDWALTTPLLLFTYWKLGQTRGYTGSFLSLLIPNILMIFFGYLAEFPELIDYTIDVKVLYILSSAALVFVLYQIYLITRFLHDQDFDTKSIEYFFYIGWTAYGLNFLVPNECLRQSIFNVLDLINKGVYSLYLDNVIKSNSVTI